MNKKIKKGIIIFIVLAGIGGIFELLGINEEDTGIQENAIEETEKVAVEEVEKEPEKEQREESIGQSDKDFLGLTKTKPNDVRGDKTGNWRKITIAESIDIVDYVASYNDLYMEDGQVHAIINFNHNTTAMINDLGDLISVSIHEYVDNEEHDANILGSGMLLKEYHVYKDNGDIIEIQ